jgi:acyl carrier protein
MPNTPDIVTTIEKALNQKPGTVTESTQAKDISDWDSLGQLSVLVALDKLFSGKIAGIKEMAEADSVPKILSILKKNSLL